MATVRVQCHHLAGFFRQTPRVSIPLEMYSHVDRCFGPRSLQFVIIEIACFRGRTFNCGAYNFPVWCTLVAHERALYLPRQKRFQLFSIRPRQTCAGSARLGAVTPPQPLGKVLACQFCLWCA